MKTWGSVTLTIAEADADLVASSLFDLGTTGVEQLDAPPGAARLRAYFDGDVPSDLVDSLRRSHGEAVIRAIEIGSQADEDWAENWKLHFEAQRVGRRLLLCPPWDATTNPERIRIVIEPGMAFGTGQHATTRGCLELLEEWLMDRRVERAADIGTGSGVLAIALAKLGVPRIVAVDNDEDALRIAAENAVINEVDTAIRFSTTIDPVPADCDLIVANLFADLLVELAPAFDERMRRDGTIVLSGILSPDAERVLDSFANRGWSIDRRRDEEPWVALRLTRNLP